MSFLLLVFWVESLIFIVCVCVCVCAHAQSCLTLGSPVVHQAPLYMEFSGKNTGVGCRFLLQGIFRVPGLEPPSLVSPVSQMNSLPLSQVGSPNLLSWVVWLVNPRKRCLEAGGTGATSPKKLVKEWQAVDIIRQEGNISPWYWQYPMTMALFCYSSFSLYWASQCLPLF